MSTENQRHIRNDFQLSSDPWQKFTIRWEPGHNAEDVRLCSPTQTTQEIIEAFLLHNDRRSNAQIPRRWQVLGEFLYPIVTLSQGDVTTYVEDIERHRAANDVAILDDRQKHECARDFGQHCEGCPTFSENLDVMALQRRLQEKRSSLKAEKRIIYIPNLTSVGAFALIGTLARRAVNPVRGFLHRYLGRHHFISISTSWGFSLEFHLPYHAMRHGPLESTQDLRIISGKRLRKSEPLPLGSHSRDQEDLYYHEAQTSSICWGISEWFWTEIFVVDTYFGSEESPNTYLRDCPYGKGSNPLLGGSGTLNDPRFDPREYFLRILEYRMEQVATEYGTLVDIFNRRMENYLNNTRHESAHSSSKLSAKGLSKVIETIQTFSECIYGTVDSWERFCNGEMSLFTTRVPNQSVWPRMIASISRSVGELDRLRKLLLAKRDTFKLELDGIILSFVMSSGLNWNQAASQGPEFQCSGDSNLEDRDASTVDEDRSQDAHHDDGLGSIPSLVYD
ncbi:hypothetical protein IQ07DRAFT_679915 [Pyrenochaeta sp. DS3sAY3a]|nr:hypothetical protein IQ07DRAFT_679915 [Pyrenochaeta sp. DS3sAY3a]